MARSRAYYQTPAGKSKKRLQNGRRRKPAPLSEEKAEEPSMEPKLAAIEFNPSLLDYIRLLTSLIEVRRVSREEVLDMLRRTLRQHSFARETRIDYVVRTLKEAPP